jgi:hypothetical protein
MEIFWKRDSFFTFVCNRYIPKGIRICQNDADPAGSRSGSTTLVPGRVL